MKVNLNNAQAETLGELFDCSDWDRTFEYEGRPYAVIKKGDSQFTTLEWQGGYIPCFNLKSHTIRGLHRTTQVQPLITTVNCEAGHVEEVEEL